MNRDMNLLQEDTLKGSSRKAGLFSIVDIGEDILLPESLPGIGDIISCIVEPEIVSLKVLNTPKGRSAEGQGLTGECICTGIVLKQKFLYAPENQRDAVNIFETECYKCIYTSVPQKIEGTDMEAVVDHRLLKPVVKAEAVNVSRVNSRLMFERGRIIIEFHIMNTYELCCSMENHNTCGIFICCADGTRLSRIVSNGKRSIKPQWAPDGRAIAYLSGDGSLSSLCILELTDLSVKKITDAGNFQFVSSFCWAWDGSIIFSSCVDGGKELYMVDPRSLAVKQLTHGGGGIISYKPGASIDGRIAFIRSVSGVTSLCLMNDQGCGLKEIGETGGISEFDWSHDGMFIAAVRKGNLRGDELTLIDIRDYRKHTIDICSSVEKRNARFSPDGEWIGFIGTEFNTDNIYIYSMALNRAVNITNSPSGASIECFVWNMDSDKIYYSLNGLQGYNVWSIDLDNLSRRQLTSIGASGIYLSYRPRLG